MNRKSEVFVQSECSLLFVIQHLFSLIANRSCADYYSEYFQAFYTEWQLSVQWPGTKETKFCLSRSRTKGLISFIIQRSLSGNYWHNTCCDVNITTSLIFIQLKRDVISSKAKIEHDEVATAKLF